MSTKKPRSDSKLDWLPEEHKAKLADWMLSGIPYWKIKELVDKEFSVQTSLAALSAFWNEYCSAELIARRAQAVSAADAVADEAARTPGRFDAATIDALKQRAFELAISPGADPKAVKAIFALVLKARDQSLAERELSLAEAKFEEQQQRNQQASEKLKEAIDKGGLSSETIEEIEEAMNLL